MYCQQGEQRVPERRGGVSPGWRRAAAGLAVCSLVGPASAQRGPHRSAERSWTHVGGAAHRHSLVALPCAPSQTPSWVRSRDISGNEITFVAQAGVAVFAGERVQDGLVFATGRVSPEGQPPNQYKLFAFARSNGAVRWQSSIARPGLDSFSSPALDESNGVVLHASGRRLQAFRIQTGEPVWERTLSNYIVNASPMVTEDRGPADRIFITDYDGFDRSARLYCINADPHHPVRNPYEPGEIVWSYPIGNSSGNSVSYLSQDLGGEGMVYVASARPEVGEPGVIYAFPAADSVSAPAWTYHNEIPEGYFGGVCVVPRGSDEPPGSPPSLYAAAYAFATDSGLDSGLLVKLNARTGEQIWSVPANRTASIPVPLPGGRVALSAGIQGYGSTPNLQMFEDLGQSAQLVWDTAGLFLMGGWSHQPVAAQFGGRDVVAIGVPPEEYTNASAELLVVDLAVGPTDPSFVVGRYPGAGGSVAIVGTSIYSVGTLGLVALGPTPLNLDVNGDGTLGTADLYAWERGVGGRDVNADGTVSAEDRAELISSLRATEPAAMSGARE